MLFVNLAFLLCFCSSILQQNCFGLFVSGFWFDVIISPSTSWQNFLSLFWNVLFCLYCFTPSGDLLNIHSSAKIFWFTSLGWIVTFFLLFRFCVFIPTYCRVYFSFLDTSVYSCSLILRLSSLTSHPSFVFLIMFLKCTPILSQISFAPA